MNVDNILKVADMIAATMHSGYSGEMGFNMQRWIAPTANYGCGTTACICGWAELAKAQETHGEDFYIRSSRFNAGYEHVDFGADYFGISFSEAYDLFLPKGYYSQANSRMPYFEEIPPWMAVNVLRRLANTGEVDWRKAWLAGEDCARREAAE